MSRDAPLIVRQASKELCNKVIDRHEILIENILDEFMGDVDSDAMWLVWHTLRIGMDVILEKGTDFRLLDYERRQTHV